MFEDVLGEFVRLLGYKLRSKVGFVGLPPKQYLKDQGLNEAKQRKKIANKLASAVGILLLYHKGVFQRFQKK